MHPKTLSQILAIGDGVHHLSSQKDSYFAQKESKKFCKACKKAVKSTPGRRQPSPALQTPCTSCSTLEICSPGPLPVTAQRGDGIFRAY
jgi:hypothetical protein